MTSASLVKVFDMFISKLLISSRPTVSADSRSFCAVQNASTQENIWIRDSGWPNRFAYLQDFQERDQRTAQTSAVICSYLSFVNEDLRVHLPLSAIDIDQLFDLSVPNAVPSLV